MTDAEITAIQEHVAKRVAELGGSVEAADITVLPYDGPDPVPGIRAFVASYPSRGGTSAMTGILDENGPNTRPLDAITRVFQAWLADGGLPNPVQVADLVAFIRAGGDHYTVIRSDADVAKLPKEEWRSVARPPQPIEVGGRPGVEFWSGGPFGLTRTRVYAPATGKVKIEDRGAADVLQGK